MDKIEYEKKGKNYKHTSLYKTKKYTINISQEDIINIPLEFNLYEDEYCTKRIEKDENGNYSSDELKPIRELFLNARTLYIYRLGSNGVKASGSLATAKYPGTLGNKIKIVTTAIVDDETTTGYRVQTFLDNVLIF